MRLPLNIIFLKTIRIWIYSKRKREWDQERPCASICLEMARFWRKKFQLMLQINCHWKVTKRNRPLWGLASTEFTNIYQKLNLHERSKRFRPSWTLWAQQGNSYWLFMENHKSFPMLRNSFLSIKKLFMFTLQNIIFSL